MGDMQQIRHYTVRVEGAPDKNSGASFHGKDYGHQAVIAASQYFSEDDVKALPVEGYESRISLDKKSDTLIVTYKKK